MQNGYGLNGRQSTWVVVIFISITLIIFSSITLYFRYIKKDISNYREIKFANQKLSILRNISNYGLNTQRFSNNLMIYHSDSSELNFSKSKIMEFRNNLNSNLKSYALLDKSSASLKDSMLLLGNEYLEKNLIYLSRIESNDSATAYDYRINITRPLLEQFLAHNKKISDQISEEINSTTLSNSSIFSYAEFWLLLVGIFPFAVLYLTVIKNFLQVLIWEIIF